MKKISLRDANQQFSKIVREVEETGEPVSVLRNGKKAVRIIPEDDRAAVPTLTPAQEAAKLRLMNQANHFTLPPKWKFSRDEIHDEAVLRHGVVRRIWLAEEKAKRDARSDG